MTRQITILVVEDEAAIREGLIDVLIFHGYAVESADNGNDGLRMSLSGTFDLVLLDIMLPGIDGYQICNKIREQDRVQPIIMLTAKTSDDEIVHGLRLGADDYVAKPFSVQQLMLRIDAVLRRSKIGIEREKTLVLGGLAVDTDTLLGKRGSQEIAFTKREVELLTYLAANHERPLSREELLAKVWGYGKNLDIETRTVDIHIAKLRRKIEVDAKQPKILVTVRGAGYQLISEQVS